MLSAVKKVMWVVVLAMSIATSASQAQVLKYPSLTKRGFEQMVTLHNEILKHCPPQDCLRVYVGRSSALLMAYGEAQSLATSQVGLPLSGMKMIEPNRLNAVYERFKLEVLEPMLRTPLEQGFSKIAVIDFMNGGSTLVKTSEMIHHWLQHEVQLQGLSPAMQVLGYGGMLSSELEHQLSRLGLALERLPFSIGPGIEGDFSELIHNSKAEGYAPYDRWNPLENSKPPEVNRSLRKPYRYRGPNNETAYASFDDLVQWMKKPQLSDDCNFAWHYRNFVN